MRSSIGRRPSDFVVDPHRVPHVARRVVGRDAQRLEVVVVQLDLGPLDDGEAHRAEDVEDCAQQLRHGVQPAARDAAAPAASRRASPSRSTPRRAARRSSLAARLERRLQLRFSAFAAAPSALRSSIESSARPRSTPVSRPLRPRYSTRQASSAVASVRRERRWPRREAAQLSRLP